MDAKFIEKPKIVLAASSGKTAGEWEILFNQAEVDIEAFKKDEKARLFKDNPGELCRRILDIGKKLGQAELLAKQYGEAKAKQRAEEANIDNAEAFIF